MSVQLIPMILLILSLSVLRVLRVSATSATSARIHHAPDGLSSSMLMAMAAMWAALRPQ